MNSHLRGWLLFVGPDSSGRGVPRE